MEFDEVIRNRHSIRVFSDQPVEPEMRRGRMMTLRDLERAVLGGAEVRMLHLRVTITARRVVVRCLPCVLERVPFVRGIVKQTARIARKTLPREVLERFPRTTPPGGDVVLFDVIFGSAMDADGTDVWSVWIVPSVGWMVDGSVSVAASRICAETYGPVLAGYNAFADGIGKRGVAP
jgi:hypothetical protein